MSSLSCLVYTLWVLEKPSDCSKWYILNVYVLKGGGGLTYDEIQLPYECQKLSFDRFFINFMFVFHPENEQKWQILYHSE